MKRILKKSALIFLAVLSLSGCAVTPSHHDRETVSFDKNDRNSGIIGFLPDGSLEITEGARSRYNGLIEEFGEFLTPDIQKDFGVTPYENGNYSLTLEAAEKWKAMLIIHDRERVRKSETLWNKIK